MSTEEGKRGRDALRRVAVQQPEHAPWLGFFHKMLDVDRYIYLDNVQFKKRYFENRNKIRTAEGWRWVTAPVLVKGRYSQRIDEVELLPDNGWKRTYAGRLNYSYRKAPYGRELLTWATGHWVQGAEGPLVEMNLAFIERARGELGITTPTWKASELLPDNSQGLRGSELILELCRLAGAGVYVSGPDGARYLDLEAFAAEGIEVEFHRFDHPVYPQMHSGSFLSHMSVMDALFNLGPEGTRRMIEQPL